MSGSIEIVHLYPSLTADADGAASVVRSLIREQLRQSCTIYFGSHPIACVEELKQLRVTWHDVFRSAYHWFGLRFKSQFRIKEEHSPRIIHVHGLWDPKVLLLSIFQKRKGDVCVHSTHGMMSSFSFNYKKLKKLTFHFLFQSPVIKKYEIHIANSEYELVDLRLNFSGSRSIAIPNGVDPIPQSFSLSQKRSSILYFGRIHNKKNVHLLIDGFGLAQRSNPNLALEIVGSGDPHYISELKAMIIKNDIHGINFKPAIEYEKRFEVFQNALVTALPSENENFGLVVAESLACGVPVIVSENMPWKDVVKRGCGWIVDTTPESIAEVLVSVSKKSEGELIEMGRIGAEWIRDDFSWQKINQITLELYRELLDEKAGSVDVCNGPSQSEP